MDTKLEFIGYRASYKLIATKTDFRNLDKSDVIFDFQKAKNGLIVLNMEGVLPDPQKNTVVLQALDSLSKQATVFVISNHVKEKMHKTFAEGAPKLGIAAENGFFYRLSSEKNKDWTRLLKVDDFLWMDPIKNLIQNYSVFTEGSYLEVKESMLIWRYQNTDPDYGEQAKTELTKHLKESFNYMQIDIIQGKQCLEIVPKQLKKKKLISTILREITKEQEVDFMMYVGEDTQNTDIFKYLNRNVKNKGEKTRSIKQETTIYSCTIGRKVTQANFFLTGADHVLTMLEKMA